MADVKWIKIVTDIFDDDKILLIEGLPDADAIIVMWFKLLCLAGKHNNGGVFTINGRIPYTDEMFSTIMRRPLNTVRLALKTFEQYGMIEVVNHTVTIPNWEKHQSLERLELARDATRKRVATHREKQKQLVGEQCNALHGVTEGVTVTLCNADRIEKNSLEGDKKENRGDIGVTVPADAVTPPPKRSKSKKQFEIPTIDEVAAYCAERKNNIDPEYFWAWYDARGWKQGNGKPVEKWRSCVITWEKRDRERGENNGRQNAVNRGAANRGNDKPDTLGSWDINGRTII